MRLARRIAVVFLAPWFLLSLQISGIQHQVAAGVLILNGLVAAAVVWLWFVIPMRLAANTILGALFIAVSIVIWNVPWHQFTPPSIAHAEPYARMIGVGLIYRLGVAMIHPLDTTVSSGADVGRR